MSVPTDAELLPHIEAMASGDPQGLLAFHAGAGPWALAAIEAIVGPGEAAHALLEAVFLDLWREAPHYDRHFGRPLMWALAAAREAAVASLDRHQRGALDGEMTLDAGALDRLDPGARDALIRSWKGVLPTPDGGAAALRSWAALREAE